jgi:hypothetical protein
MRMAATLCLVFVLAALGAGNAVDALLWQRRRRRWRVVWMGRGVGERGQQ